MPVPFTVSADIEDFLRQESLAPLASQAYVDAQVAGLLDYRGDHSASGNTFPTTGGSGSGGAVKKGDVWMISVAGTLGGTAVTAGDTILAKIDTPGQTAANWSVIESNIGYVPATAAQGAKADTAVQPGDFHGATAKTTPVDADEMSLWDSAAVWVLKKVTWANVKATLTTYFDAVYANLTGSNVTAKNAFRTAIDAAYFGPILPNTEARLHTTHQGYDPMRLSGIITGDSYAVDLGYNIDASVVPYLGAGMGQGVSYVGPGNFTTGDFTRSPSGINFALSASGHSVTYPVAAASFYRMNVFYTTDPGVPGSFAMESNTEGAGWVPIPITGQQQIVIREGNTYPAVNANGTLVVVITAAGFNGGSPYNLNVAVTNGRSWDQWPADVRTAMAADSTLMAFFTVAGTSNTFGLKKKTYAADDPTFTITMADALNVGVKTLQSWQQTAGYAPISTATGSTLGAQVFTHVFPSSYSRQVRVIWVSGTVRILGFTSSDVWRGATARGGYEGFDMAFSGQSVGSAYACPQQIFDVFGQTLRPDFLTFKSDDGAAAISGYLQTYMDKWKASTSKQFATLSFDSQTVGASTVTATITSGSSGGGTASISGGVVTGITPIIPNYAAGSGSGYTSAPTVTITAAPGGTGSGATATCAINSVGQITSFTVTNGGSGYNPAPVVTIGTNSDIVINVSVPDRTGPFVLAGLVRTAVMGNATLAARFDFPEGSNQLIMVKKTAYDYDISFRVILTQSGGTGLTSVGTHVNGTANVLDTGSTFNAVRPAEVVAPTIPDWILVGTHPVYANQLSTPSAQDLAMVAVAEANDALYVNTRRILPSFTDMQRLGLINGDWYHLSPRGNAFVNDYIIELLRPTLKYWKMHTRWASNGTSVENSASYLRGSPCFVSGGGAAAGLIITFATEYGAAGNFKPLVAFNKFSDGSISMGTGQFNSSRYVISSEGFLQISGSYDGFGNGSIKPTRYANARIDMVGGNRTADTQLAFSLTSTHTGNVWGLYRNTTDSTQGTLTAWMTAAGVNYTKGTIAGDAPGLGYVGEYYTSSVASGSAVSLSTGTAGNVTSMVLPAGDWDIVSNVNFSASSATVTAMSAGAGITSATVPTDGSEVYSGISTTTATFVDTLTPGRKRLSLATTLKSFSANNGTDTFTVNSHGYANGTPVIFTDVTGGAFIVPNIVYYVINQTTNTFQVSTTVGGGALNFTTDGTGTVQSAHIVYLVAKATFSAGTMAAFGQITARRAR